MLVIIADDDEDWKDSAVRWLKSTTETSNVDARHYAQPSDLIEALQKHEFDRESAKVVFLDLEFSNLGCSGLETLQVLKEHVDEHIRSIPVIIYSRSDSEEEVSKSYASKANSYVHKGSTSKRQKKIFIDTVRFWMETAKLPS